MNFTINRDQIARLKMLQSYIGKMEAFSPINNKQTFVISDKLSIYGTGNGHIEANFDITNIKLSGKDYFGMELNKFINYLDKIKDDEINVSITNNVMNLKSKGKLEIKETLISETKNKNEIDELVGFITTKLAEKEFKSVIEVKLENKELMNELASLTKFQDSNRQILIGKNYIKTADNLCITSFNTTENLTTDEEVLLDRDIISLFKNVDSFKISSDKSYYYFDIVNNNIKILFQPKSYNWTYPNETELAEIKPIDNKKIMLKINSEKFFETIDKFDGVFDSSAWRYGQIKVNSANYKTKNQLLFHFDTLSTEIIDYLPIEIISNTDNEDDFEFVLPSIYFKYLKSSLIKNETFNIEYNSLQANENNGMAIVISNDNSITILAKMLI